MTTPPVSSPSPLCRPISSTGATIGVLYWSDHSNPTSDLAYHRPSATSAVKPLSLHHHLCRNRRGTSDGHTFASHLPSDLA
ncbi:hypothetical protein LXL04_037654 [Taraxacum kok-saghyz]